MIVVTLSTTQQVTGYFYPYSHLPGGMLLIPPSTSSTLSFQALGKLHVVVR